MFQFENIEMVIVEGEIKQFTVHPDHLYPAVIDRIREVLAGEDAPTELKQSTYLVSMAKALPESAWDDALLGRHLFIDVPFATFVQDGKPRQDLIDMLQDYLKADVLRMVNRGLALDIARRWFTRSLGNEYGRCDLHITTGIEDDKAFRL